MRKALALILTLMLMVTMANMAFAEDATTTTAEEYPIPEQLTIGSTTQMSGKFFTELWGANTADLDVRALIHGYSTIHWGNNGNYEPDETVVSATEVTDDASGNRTYRFTINQDLKYSDGTQITAKDYVFSVLFLSSPLLTEMGAVTSSMEHLVGQADFLAGNPFSGVRLLGDYQFSLTIAANRLPYFYELAYVNVTPYPISVIAPECDVMDDGQGAYIDGPYTAELIEKTVLDPDTGYLYMPTVTSGAYRLTGYNRESHEATFEANALYKGNFEGKLPVVSRLVFKQADTATMFDELRAGTLDVINKISAAEQIVAGQALAGEDPAAARLTNYPRSGFSFLSFACEMGPTQSLKVRQAIAMCVDVPALVTEYMPNFAMPVYAHYGVGQQMAQTNLQALSELAVSLNINAANNLLDDDGWTLNADGTAYDVAAGGIRYRAVEGGDPEELVIRWAKPEGSGSADILEGMLTENFAQVGIRLEITQLPFAELLTHYYRQTDRTYNMFSAATNFGLVYDPYYTVNSGEAYQHEFNTTGIADEKLEQLAADMRRTEPGDMETFSEKWLAFQTRWAEVLPAVPLYSNVYCDVWRPDMYGYAVNSNWSWANAILYIGFGEEPVEEVTPLDGEETDELKPAS